MVRNRNPPVIPLLRSIPPPSLGVGDTTPYPINRLEYGLVE
jgi:hypothetical protein